MCAVGASVHSDQQWLESANLRAYTSAWGKVSATRFFMQRLAGRFLTTYSCMSHAQIMQRGHGYFPPGIVLLEASLFTYAFIQVEHEYSFARKCALSLSPFKASGGDDGNTM